MCSRRRLEMMVKLMNWVSEVDSCWINLINSSMSVMVLMRMDGWLVGWLAGWLVGWWEWWSRLNHGLIHGSSWDRHPLHLHPLDLILMTIILSSLSLLNPQQSTVQSPIHHPPINSNSDTLSSSIPKLTRSFTLQRDHSTHSTHSHSHTSSSSSSSSRPSSDWP